VYADGEFSSLDIPNYINDGQETGTAYKDWSFYDLRPSGWPFKTLPDRAAALIGTTFMSAKSEPGYWGLELIGSLDSTALVADGFQWWMYPEGNTGESIIIVTYKLDRVNVADGDTLTEYDAGHATCSYNADAGYEVYHLSNT
jgi:hypothetical protein